MTMIPMRKSKLFLHQQENGLEPVDEKKAVDIYGFGTPSNVVRIHNQRKYCSSRNDNSNKNNNRNSRVEDRPQICCTSTTFKYLLIFSLSY
jgi:hypothetical protein